MHAILKYVLLFSVAWFGTIIQAQTPQSLYYDTFSQVESMLSDKDSLDFKKAVFLTENAYFENHLNEEIFNAFILFNTSICRGIMASGNLIYPESDMEKASAQCAVFVFMTDTVPVEVEDGIVIHTPFSYNFDDFAGQKDWSNMFVSTLMHTKQGNCHLMYKYYHVAVCVLFPYPNFFFLNS